MPNLVIIVKDVNLSGLNGAPLATTGNYRVIAQVTVEGTDGTPHEFEMEVAFGGSANAQNASIVTQSVAKIEQKLGITVSSGDRKALVCGIAA